MTKYMATHNNITGTICDTPEETAERFFKEHPYIGVCYVIEGEEPMAGFFTSKIKNTMREFRKEHLPSTLDQQAAHERSQ